VHQALHGAPGDRRPLADQLASDLADAVHALLLVCEVPWSVCPTAITGSFANGVLHFQYYPDQDVFFDGTYVSP
jgi:hypothetical protein